jgi:1-acyl-sn-glycerol-3-phosphate acyltransferase
MVMKAELRHIPFHGWFSRKFEHVFVARERGPGALRQLLRDAKARAAARREVVIFPEGTRRPPGAEPDYKPGVVALYEGLELPCVPIALNSGLYWPRRSLMRYPGTIIVEILDPIPAGLPRADFRAELERRIETASDRLIEEAARSAEPPPIPADRLARAQAGAKA